MVAGFGMIGRSEWCRDHVAWCRAGFSSDSRQQVHTRLNLHPIAHSFGAWVVLSLAMQRKPRLLILTLLEPTTVNLMTMPREA